MAFITMEHDQHIFELHFKGVFTPEDAEKFAPLLTNQYKMAERAGKRVNLLVDATDLKNMSVEGRRTIMELHADKRLDSVAIIGLNRVMKIFNRFIVVATGRQNVSFFDSKNDAIAWLDELAGE